MERIFIRQEARGSHDREMIFTILCNFRYFRSYVLCNFRYFRSYDCISLILGIFKIFLVKLKSCYDTISIRICLRIFLLGRYGTVSISLFKMHVNKSYFMTYHILQTKL